MLDFSFFRIKLLYMSSGVVYRTTGMTLKLTDRKFDTVRMEYRKTNKLFRRLAGN